MLRSCLISLQEAVGANPLYTHLDQISTNYYPCVKTVTTPPAGAEFILLIAISRNLVSFG